MSKAQKAAEAIKANPQMSNRAIAKEIGADEGTVRKARSTADHSAVDDEPRTGLDGKQRRMPSRPIIEDDDDDDEDIDVSDYIKPPTPTELSTPTTRGSSTSILGATD